MTSALFAGCASVGPPTLPRDRFDYVEAISSSWKRQMLQNLVKIRYTDAPVFLDVTSVINSYAMESNLSAGGQLAQPGRGDMFATIGAGAYGDKPTITYGACALSVTTCTSAAKRKRLNTTTFCADNSGSTYAEAFR